MFKKTERMISILLTAAMIITSAIPVYGGENQVIMPAPVGPVVLSQDNIGDWETNYDSVYDNVDIHIYQYTGTASSLVIPSKVTLYGKERNITIEGSAPGGSFSDFFPETLKEIEIDCIVLSPRYILNHSKIASVSFNGAIIIGGGDASSTSQTEIFYGNTSIQNVTFKNCVFEDFTDLGNMFKDCTGLRSLVIDSNDPDPEFKGMADMFSGCTNLKSVQLKNITFNGDGLSSGASASVSAEIMSGAFSGCEKLQFVEFDGVKFNAVDPLKITMNSLFGDCGDLQTVVFSNMSSPDEMNNTFSGCSGLKTVSFNNFDMSGVQNISYMFNNCTSLEKIYVDDSFNGPDPNVVSEADSVFDNCDKLTGFRGTAWDDNNTDLEYFRVDDPLNNKGSIIFSM